MAYTFPVFATRIKNGKSAGKTHLKKYCLRNMLKYASVSKNVYLCIVVCELSNHGKKVQSYYSLVEKIASFQTDRRNIIPMLFACDVLFMHSYRHKKSGQFRSYQGLWRYLQQDGANTDGLCLYYKFKHKKMEQKRTEFLQFRIDEVSGWLSNESKVKLPVVQRGFVWKVSQIECLWDSIFRGYPIGAMMMAREGDSLWLLDGQQRATAIALGFYNPWIQKMDKIGNANNLPVVWIDVCPQKKIDTFKYVFRVVTRSHPWGYQLQNDGSILGVAARREANAIYKRLFNQNEYTKLSPCQRLPYDTTCPIPLCFLLEAGQKSLPGEKIVEMCKKHIPEGYRTSGMTDDDTYYSMLDKIDLSTLIKTVTERVLTTMIPSIILPDELLIDRNDTATDESTLFIRLNSQGTRIEGEELIYSMFKSVCPATKDLVERIGLNIIPPSRIITLTSRLILSTDSFVSGISLAQFRRHIQDKEFVTKLQEWIGDTNNSPIKNEVERAIDILRYGDVPNVVVKKFIRENPDGFMLLLHWLCKNENVQVDDTKKKEIASRLYRNHWFGNDFGYYVRKNWNLVKDPDFWSDRFFSNEEWLREYPLIKPELLQDFLINRLDNPVENHELMPDDEEIWRVWCSSLPKPENIEEGDYYKRIKDAWLNFLWKLLGSRDKSLILLAQRDYINHTFADFNQIEDLDDTNTPWDWDHIYPHSWVYRQWNIDSRTRNWEWRIGNFRAMSLTDNRSENAYLSPAERFDSPNDEYFIKENDLEYWKKLDGAHNNIKEGDEEYVKFHAKAIIIRTVNIYENFLKMFL